VFINGQVPTHLNRMTVPGMHTVGITRPCNQHNWLVRN